MVMARGQQLLRLILRDVSVLVLRVDALNVVMTMSWQRENAAGRTNLVEHIVQRLADALNALPTIY